MNYRFQKAVWFAHHMVRVLTQYFHIPDANKRWASCLITECLVENAPDPNSYVLVIMSILDPGEFSKHMGETLTKRIIRTKRHGRAQCGAPGRVRMHTAPDR